VRQRLRPPPDRPGRGPRARAKAPRTRAR
jgi:hypothetical protein